MANENSTYISITTHGRKSWNENPRFKHVMNDIVRACSQSKLPPEKYILLRHVVQFVEQLNNEAAALDTRDIFKAIPELSGSMANGVHTDSSDCDFMVILTNSDEWMRNATLCPTTPLTAKRRRQVYPEESNLKAKSFFHIRVPEDIAGNLETFVKCATCKDPDDCSSTHQGDRYLCARTFRTRYEQLISESSQSDSHDNKLEKILSRGPAVTVHRKFDARELVIDMVLGIEITNESNIWPFDGGVPGLTLRHDTRMYMNRCHLIPAGDYWQLSFAIYEKEIMKTLMPEQKMCLRFLKVRNTCSRNCCCSSYCCCCCCCCCIMI